MVKFSWCKGTIGCKIKHGKKSYTVTLKYKNREGKVNI